MKKGEHSKPRDLGGGRGLVEYAAIVDTHDQIVTVQSSSSIDAACWIFCRDREGFDRFDKVKPGGVRSPHLSPRQAKRLARMLIKWAEANE